MIIMKEFKIYIIKIKPKTIFKLLINKDKLSNEFESIYKK